MLSLALTMDRLSQAQECKRPLEVESGPLATASKEKELDSCKCKEIDFVINLNELGSGSFPEPLNKSSIS